MTETALIVEAPQADVAIGDLRTEFDETVALGVPAHVTILYPFVPHGALTGAMLDTLRALAERTPAFDYLLTEPGRFDTALWLRPVPDEPFRTLTSAVWRRFPNWPPYRGAHSDIRPHLTVADRASVLDDDGRTRAFEATLAARLPIRCEARALSLFVRDGTGRFERRATLPFADVVVSDRANAPTHRSLSS